jgi:hypothetical protein
MDDKRSVARDPGEREQNQAVVLGLTDAPVPETVTAATQSGKCPTCGRDKANS